MANLNLDVDFMSHPKVWRLIREAGFAGIGWLIAIWCHCAKHHPESGDITDEVESGQIDAILQVQDAQNTCILQLVRTGFLDTYSRRGRKFFRVHSWDSHQGHLLKWKQRGKLNAEKRWSKLDATGNAIGNATSNATGNAPNQAYLNQAKLNQAKLSNKENAAAPPSQKIDNRSDKKLLKDDCIGLLKVKLAVFYSISESESAKMIGYIYDRLNPPSFKLEPEQFWWLLTHKCKLPPQASNIYAWANQARKSLESSWASAAREAVPLSERSGSQRIGS